MLRVPGKECANSGLWGFGTWRHFRLDAGIPPDFLQTLSVPSLGSQELGIMRLVRTSKSLPSQIRKRRSETARPAAQPSAGGSSSACGWRGAAAAGAPDGTERSSHPSPAALPHSPRQHFQAAEQGWGAGRALQERGACRAGADTSDKSNLFLGHRLDGN